MPAYPNAQRRYRTVDVFTDHVFGGNPLAVVLDAQGLTTLQMQAIAREFNYSETTFVLPAHDPAHTAHVRIFTSRVEVPFAGHPNIGTAVILAQEIESNGRPPSDELLFEEAAGVVPVRILREGGEIVGAEFRAPEQLAIGARLAGPDLAACLSLDPADILSATHAPQVLSVGLPFLVAELATRDALRRAKPDIVGHEQHLPPLGTDAIFCYYRERGSRELHARMFSPLDNTVEDPATGSATAATIALLASLEANAPAELLWRSEQGVDMGRPSLLRGRTEQRAGVVTGVHIAGRTVMVMRGHIHIPSADVTSHTAIRL